MSNKEIWQRLTELLGEAELSRRFRLWANGLIKKELAKRANLAPDEFFLHQAGEIISDLNTRTGRRYSLTEEAKGMIRRILGAGYQVEDFRKVHQVMIKKWGDDEKFKDYLRPSTLYQLKKFDERRALWTEPKAASKEHRATGQEGRKAEDHSSLIRELLGKPWHSFGSWAEMYKWTLRFPDAASLASYPMPERIRRMRTAPNMMVQVLTGKSPEWAEAEYQELKQKVAE